MKVLVGIGGGRFDLDVRGQLILVGLSRCRKLRCF